MVLFLILILSPTQYENISTVKLRVKILFHYFQHLQIDRHCSSSRHFVAKLLCIRVLHKLSVQMPLLVTEKQSVGLVRIRNISYSD